MPDATDIHATHATCLSGGGRQMWLASVLRFCAIAARWNSSRAPERPRRRMRSKRWWVFRCAKRISTFLRSSLDCSNSGVPIVGLNDAGIDGEAFALNKTCVHASSHHRLEHMAQNIAVAKPAMEIDREGRMIGDLVI